MTMITAKLNLEQFKTIFSTDPAFKSLSNDSIAYCFEVVESLQGSQTNRTNLDWRDVFNSAKELTSAQLVEHYSEILIQYDNALISMADDLTLPSQLAAIIEDPELSDYIKIREHLAQFLEVTDFVEGAAGILARDNFWHAMDNGLWLKL